MNFLEGLKRLYLLFALLIVGFLAIAGWSDAAPPAFCNKPAAVANPFDKFDPPQGGYVCPSNGEAIARQAFRGGAFGLGGAFILFIVWLALRWIIVGFFPNATRRT